MGRGNSVLRIAVPLVLVAALAACNPPVRRHGYVPPEVALHPVEVGVSRAAVAAKIGRPSSAGLLQGGDWFYVGSTWQQVAWRAPQETSREVVAIRFDGGETVTNIERFGLEDGQVVALSRRVTDSNIRGVSFIRQLLGNIGNFNPAQFIDDE